MAILAPEFKFNCTRVIYDYNYENESEIHFAALSMTLFVGCSHDTDFSMPSTEEALQNAAEKLGVEIDPSMTWNAATAIKTNVSVNLGLDEEYTVVIYDKNPLFNDDVHYYAKTTMKEGETVTLNLDVPTMLTSCRLSESCTSFVCASA